MKSTLHLVFVAALAATAANAGTITIAFDTPDQTGVVGQTLSFFGVLTHVGVTGEPDIYLNSDSLDLTTPGAFVLDNFFTNVPLFLSPGQSSGLINLFDVTLPIDVGLYAGTYQLIGGADGGTFSASDNLAQADFSVTVATPEPGTVVVLAGLAALVWRRASGRQHGQSRN